jgi:hypothetical protein
LLIDDPDKRVADPERQHAKAVWRRQRDLSPAQKRLVLVLIISMAVTLPAIFLGQGVYDTHAYSVGAPATATNIHCEQGKGRFDALTDSWRARTGVGGLRSVAVGRIQLRKRLRARNHS